MDLGFFEEFPQLETPRLLLRQLRSEDAEAVLQVFGDPEVTRYYDLETMTDVARASALISLLEQRFAKREGLRWALVNKADQRVIGSMGFNSLTAAAHKASLGYEVARQVWGQGYATEALSAVVQFAHQRVGLNRLEAVVLPGNLASIAVLRKLGFEAEGLLRAFGYWKGGYQDLLMYSLLRTQ